MIAAILFLLVFFIVALIMGAFRKKNYVTEEGRFRLAGMIKLVAAFIITIILVAVNPVNVERIDAGHVGIKVSNVGDDWGVGRTEYVTGWVFYNSWISRIYEFPITNNTSITKPTTS